MPRYTLLPGKKHYYSDGNGGHRQLQPGDTVELSEKAYLAVSDKFIPEGSAVNAEDVNELRAQLARAQAEIRRRDEEDAAREKAHKDQSPNMPPKPVKQVTAESQVIDAGPTPRGSVAAPVNEAAATQKSTAPSSPANKA